MLDRTNERILQIVITILALGDGLLHFSLDFILFRGNFFGSPFPAGPRPGGAPPRANPLILPLNELFLLNFIGEVVLVVLFWLSRRMLGERRWVINLLMIVYVAATIGGWLLIGRPNPMGLGYFSKAMEIVLIIALFVYTWSLVQIRRRMAAA